MRPTPTGCAAWPRAGASVHVGPRPALARRRGRGRASPRLSRPTTSRWSRPAAGGLRVWRRAEMLAAICAERRTVAVAGTHGKTSDVAMLAVILARGRPATRRYIIGGDIDRARTAEPRWDPDGEWLVVEADESDGTFLELGAEAVVVTSVEADHLDFYGDEVSPAPGVRTVRRSAAPGSRVVCADEPGAMSLAAVLASSETASGVVAGRAAVITYGTAPDAAVRIEDVALGAAGVGLLAAPGLASGWRRSGSAVPGLHNIRNATAALTMAHALGVPWVEAAPRPCATIAAWPAASSGGGSAHGVTFVDDYGHLPGEVAAMLAAAGRRLGPGGRGLPAPPLLADRGAVAGLRRRLRRAPTCWS